MSEEFDINKKLNGLSPKKKALLLLCMLLILSSLYFLTTITRIETVDYLRHGEVLCTETYVNGELNSSPCPQNTIYFPKEPQWTLEIDSLNWTSNQTLN